MVEEPPCIPVEIPAADLAPVQQWYDQGLFLQALKASERLGPLEEWRGTEARILAGRLASRLGANGLSTRLHTLAYRENRFHTQAAYFYGYCLLGNRGPAKAWEFTDQINRRDRLAGKADPDFLARQAHLAAIFRDAEAAESLLREAEALEPGRFWVAVERSLVWQSLDRGAEALALALELHAGKPESPAVADHAAALLCSQGREEEALEVLHASARVTEAGALWLSIAAIHTGRGDDRRALEALEEAERLFPLAETPLLQWIAGRRGHSLYLLSDLAGAARVAAKSGPVGKRLAEGLANGKPPGRRVSLPVDFVQQEHDTCAPATLAALAGYFGKTASQAEIAAEICYGGSPDYQQRDWALKSGFVPRGFRVTWENARLLLDRGFPFALTVTMTTASHLVAVRGYDETLKTFLVRNPSEPGPAEICAPEFFETMAPFGPRGLLLVPEERAGELEGIELEDELLYELSEAFDQALAGYRRGEAGDLLQSLEMLSPGHLLALQAAMSAAEYDRRPEAALVAADELHRRWPECARHLLVKLRLERILNPAKEILPFLETAVRKPDADPALIQVMACELARDARTSGRARALVRRILRLAPREARNLSCHAELLWRSDPARSLPWFRFASCLAETDESYAEACFRAHGLAGRVGEGIAFLEERAARLGPRSGGPSETLAQACIVVGEAGKAQSVLEAALQRRPGDGSLLRALARFYWESGDLEKAAALFNEARKDSPESEIRRGEAILAERRGEWDRASALWREIAGRETSAADAVQSLVSISRETGGDAAALRELETLPPRVLAHGGLRAFWLDLLRAVRPECHEPALRDLLAREPVNAWAMGQLAVWLAEAGMADEAWQWADRMTRTVPSDAGCAATHGAVLRICGDLPGAREAMKKALTLDPDAGGALIPLFLLCESVEARREALDFAKETLARPRIGTGDNLFNYRVVAAPLESLEASVAFLKKCREEQPHLWGAGAALTRIYLDSFQAAPALETARDLCERFPGTPGSWLLLALAHKLSGDPAQAVELARRSAALNPRWRNAVQEAVNLLALTGEPEKLRDFLKEAIDCSPREPSYRCQLAEIEWEAGQKEEALRQMETAAELDPALQHPWRLLEKWGKELGQPDRMRALADRLAADRENEAGVWLAQSYAAEPGARQLEALEKAIALAPRLALPRSERAVALFRAHQIPEALEACGDPVWKRLGPDDGELLSIRIGFETGAVSQGLDRLRALLSRNPYLTCAWSDLIARAGDPNEQKKAAEMLVALAPQNAVHHGQLAEAELRLRKTERAIPHLQHAFQLEPRYDFASRNLVAYWLDGNKPGKVGEIIETLRKNGHRWMTAELELKLFLKQRKPDQAASILRDLCLRSPEGTYYLGAAIEAFWTSRWQHRAERILLDAAYEPKVNPDMGSYWVAMRIQLKKYDPRRIDDLAECGEVGRRALCAYLDSNVPRVYRYFERLIRRHETILRQTAAMWETAGAALIRAGKLERAAQWLSAYPDYPDASPRALYLLGLSLRAKGAYEEAGCAFELSLEKPANPLAAACHIALAVEDALADRLDAAKERLAWAAGGKADGYSEILRRFAEALVRLGESRNPKARFHILRAELRKNFGGKIASADHDLVRTFRRTLRKMGAVAHCWPGLDAYFYTGVRTAKSGVLPLADAEQLTGRRIPWFVLGAVLWILFRIFMAFSSM